MLFYSAILGAGARVELALDELMRLLLKLLISITRFVKLHSFYLLFQRICFGNLIKLNILLTSSCILHSRKFPNKPSVHTYTLCLLYNCISFSISQIKTCINISIFNIATFRTYISPIFKL